LTVWCGDAQFAEALQTERLAVAWLARANAEKVEVHPFDSRGTVLAEVVRTVLTEDCEFDLPLPDNTADIEKEVQRLTKQLKWITGQLESTEKKITPQFLEKANPTARDKILQKKEDLKMQMASVEKQLQELSSGTQPVSRRDAVTAAVAATGALWPTQGARANVGEGDMLPSGAKQEERLRKGIDAWKNLATKLTTMGEISEDEWSNTQGFLRRLYTLGDDMAYLARGFRGDKKKTSEKLITTFKKQVKLADKPLKAKELDKFMTFHKEITGYLSDFTGLLADATEDLVAEGIEEVVT